VLAEQGPWAARASDGDRSSGASGTFRNSPQGAGRWRRNWIGFVSCA
jgi:hypothetical protein